jgi:hypothetical protein
MKTENFFIEYMKKDDETVYRVETINISSGGICFLRNSLITEGEIIIIKFPFKSRKVILSAKILRVEGREVGASFIDKDIQINRFVKAFNEEYLIIKKLNDKSPDKIKPRSSINKD